MTWNVYFFETARGEKLVKEFILGLEAKTIAKVTQHIDLVKVHGPFLAMPYSKKLEKDIYELRIRGIQEVRIFYMFFKNNIYLLHAFNKKTQETPVRELKVAEERKKIIENT